MILNAKKTSILKHQNMAPGHTSPPCSNTVSSTTSLSISMERQNPSIQSLLPISSPYNDKFSDGTRQSTKIKPKVGNTRQSTMAAWIMKITAKQMVYICCRNIKESTQTQTLLCIHIITLLKPLISLTSLWPLLLSSTHIQLNDSTNNSVIKTQKHLCFETPHCSCSSQQIYTTPKRNIP